MAASPYARVAYLLNVPMPSYARSSGSKHTPTTITGGDMALYSYRMLVAWRDGDDWLVVNESISPTTNRHIHAIQNTLDNLRAFTNVGEETVTAKGRFGELRPMRVIRYQAS